MRSKENTPLEDFIVICFIFALLCLGAVGGAIAREAVLKSRGRIIEEQPAYSIYDLDRNGLVNSSDTNICYDIFTGFRVATPSMLERADVDKSGIVDDKDCTLIMDAILGKVEK